VALTPESVAFPAHSASCSSCVPAHVRGVRVTRTGGQVHSGNRGGVGWEGEEDKDRAAALTRLLGAVI